MTVSCKGEGCKWRLHASVLADQCTFMVKTVQEENSCIRPADNINPNANTKWISRQLKESLMVDNNMIYELMQQKLKEKWGIDPPRWQLYRARMQVKESTEGSHSESFKYLKMYMDNLRKVNLGTVVKFEHYER